MNHKTSQNQPRHRYSHLPSHTAGPPAINRGIGRLSALLLIMLPLTLHAQCTQVTNMAAWWPGDGQAYDVINIRSAALQNGADYAVGKVGQAFSFDGATEKVRITESTKTDLSRADIWTIEAWVKPANFTNSLYPTIYSEGNKIAWLGLNSSNLESWINNDSATRLTGAKGLALNEWSHVALVNDGDHRTLYVNGLLAGATNGTPATNPDSSGASIGHVAINDPTGAFKGEIDEVSLYLRALSAGEIAAIYDAGAAGKCYTNTPAPFFVIQPTDQTNYLGATATFTGVAMGSPRPTYQWWFNGTNQLVGQTNCLLTLPNLAFAHEGNYTVVATSSAGVTTSAVARLTVRFCSDTPAGLVAWWPGDGSGLDVTSNHNGAVWGTATYPPGVVTNGPAFGFNGTNTYVAVPDSSALSPHVGTNGEMSVEAWVYLTALPTTDPHTGQGRRVVISKGDAGRWEYGLSITTAGIPEFMVWTPSGSGYASVSGGQIILNQWAHLVGTLKKGQFIRIYQDAQQVGDSASFSGDTADTGSPLYIGRRSDGQFLNGRVDEVALYNRALETHEIAALYAGGNSGKCVEDAGPAPFFPAQPAGQSGYYFLNAGLSALALGTPRPDYQWYRSNAPAFWPAIAGATNATLNFTNLSEDVEGFYRVLASNVYGVVTSQSAWLDIVYHPIVCATNGEDFEDGWNGWYADNGVWEVGVPTSGPGGAHRGSSVADTVLSGNYPAYTASRLVSPEFTLPTASGEERVQLRFWHWFNYADGGGSVQISRWTNGAWAAWETLGSPATGGRYCGAWTPVQFDLTRYAGQKVRLGFSHSSGYYTSTGWSIDEVQIWKGVPTFHNPEYFESGWRDWYAENGVWEIGTGGAHQGSGIADTVLSGNYPAYTASRLVSPEFTLPTASGEERVQLRFWHWFNYADGGGSVQISRWTNGAWAAWETLGSPATGGRYCGAWTPVQFDLTRYAGQKVRLGFSHSSGYYTSTGWSIDEVQIWKGVPTFHNPEYFESGWRDWYAENGVWEIGTGGAHQGSGIADTVLSGNYPAYTASRLVSPEFTLPLQGMGELLELRFWYKYQYADGAGVVQISVWTNGAWGAWIDLGTLASASAWTPAQFTLSPYAGRLVKLGFYHTSGYYTSLGWSIDDLLIKSGDIEIGAISGRTSNELTTVTFQVAVIGLQPGASPSFSLAQGAPDGAQIDPETGVFTWTPSECQGPGTYNIPIYVVDINNEENALGFAKVTVNEVNLPPWLHPGSGTAYVGKTNYFSLCSGDPDCPANPLTYSLLAPVPTGMTIDANTGVIRWVPTVTQVGGTNVEVRLCDGGAPNYCVTNTLTLGVTAHEPFSLQIQHASTGTVQFAILDGRTDMDYMLQQTPVLYGCPHHHLWQDVMGVSPTSSPFTFLHSPTNLPVIFFRLREN